MVTEYVSRKIGRLSFLGITFVILYHASLGCQTGDFYSYTEVIGRLTVVPFFFVISGFFFVKGYQSRASWYREAVLKRIVSLVIPYAVWCGLWVLLIKCVLCGGGVDFLKDMAICCSPGNGSLWYVKSLFIMSVFSPAIIWFVKCVHGVARGVIACAFGVFS